MAGVRDWWLRSCAPANLAPLMRQNCRLEDWGELASTGALLKMKQLHSTLSTYAI